MKIRNKYNLNFFKRMGKKHICFFILFTATSFIHAQNQTSWIYKLNEADSISYNKILTKCFKDSLSAKEKSTFWDIVNNHGGDPKEIKGIGELRKSNLVQLNLYMRLYYTDALESISTKKPTKSKERQQAELNLDNKYSSLLKMNDSLMMLISQEIPINYQGKLVLFDKQLISETLTKLDYIYKLLDYNLLYLASPLKSKEREYLLNSKLYYSQSEFEVAKQFIDSAISINPKNGSFYFLRGEYNTEINHLQSALNDFNRSIQLDSLNYEAYNLRGNVYSELNFSNLAIENYVKSIQIYPNNNVAFNNLGGAYLQINNYEGAIENFNKAIAFNVFNGVTYYNRGLANHHLKKEYNIIIDDMDSAIFLDKSIIDAYYTRGLCYSFLKKNDLALIDFNKTIEMSENHEAALINRGVLLANLKQYEKACKDFEKALSLGNVLAKTYIDKICKK